MRTRVTFALVGVALALALFAISFGWLAELAPTGSNAEPELRGSNIPRIDVHVHVPQERAEAAVAMFRRHGGVYLALNASGGHPGEGLDESKRAAERTRGALRPYCYLDYSSFEDDDFERYVIRSLQRCADSGAEGLKIFKALGLVYTSHDGSLLRIDDPRLDTLFEEAGRHHLPILIHAGDPQAFFRPPTPDNERYEELRAHPSWSFYGTRLHSDEPWPSWQEIFDQYERRVARHPNTIFLGAHFGNAPEEPDTVARMLDAYPNLMIETGARIPEIGRHSAARMHDFFTRYHDRILFGTDFQIGAQGSLVLGSSGRSPDPVSRVPFFYASHFRYFETGDRRFAHPTPIQGDWTIDGIHLSRDVLEDLYWRNAARIFDLPAPSEARERDVESGPR